MGRMGDGLICGFPLISTQVNHAGQAVPLFRTVDGWLACKALDSFCYRSSWHVVPVRNDYSEGNGGSKDEKGKNKGDKDFHGVQPIGL